MNFKTITASLLGLAALAGFLAWNGQRLAAQDEAFRAYEDCVEREYGRSPASYYQEHGSYPECR